MQDVMAPDSSLQATCQVVYEQCIGYGAGTTDAASSGQGYVDGGPTSTACNAGQFTTCAATVDQLWQCIDDLHRAYGAVPLCSAATRANLASIIQDGGALGTGTVGYPDSCVWLNSQCPGIFGGDSDGGG